MTSTGRPQSKYFKKVERAKIEREVKSGNEASPKLRVADKDLPRVSTANKPQVRSKKLAGKGEHSSDDDEEFFKNLYEFKTRKETDSIDSDNENEDRGFAPADIFLTINQLSKELEMRKRMMENADEDKKEEMKLKTKSGVDEDGIKRKTTTFDRNVQMIIREHFKDFADDDDDMSNDGDNTEEAAVNENELATDGNDMNIEQQVQKMAEALGRRVQDYRQRQSALENYFDPVEGITDHKLHKYFQKQLKLSGNEKKPKTEAANSSGELRRTDDQIDVLYPLSTEEKRKKLANLFQDLNSPIFQEIRSAANKKTHTRFHHSIIREHSITKNPAEKDTLINIGTKVQPTADESEFQIMFSDVSGSEDEVHEADTSTVKDPSIFKEKCDTVVQVIRDSAKSAESNKVPGVERILNKHKKKQAAEERMKKEFSRWFGEQENAEEERDDQPIYQVPCWQPGWTRLDKKVKEQLLENKRYQRKRPEGDPIEEYKRQLKEYELMDKVFGEDHDKHNADTEEQTNEVGERWIRIKKGTLMKDYQVRCRQGMYYLVEKKHTQQRKRKQEYSKKRMIRADGRSVTQQSSMNKNKFNVKRYLSSKKGAHRKEEPSAKKIFSRKGEAVEEIRKILTNLERKNFGEGKLRKSTVQKPSEWSRLKFIKYFKEKCKALGAQVSSDSEDADCRESFRNYFMLYYDIEQQLKQNKLKMERNSKYPLGLFKPRKSREDDVISTEDSDEERTATDESSQEDEFPTADLAREIFQFSANEAEELGKAKESQKDVSFERYSEQFKFCREGNDLRQIRTEKLKINSDSFAQHCSQLYDFPPDIRDGFFRRKGSVNTEKLNEFFAGKYLAAEDHYLKEKQSDVLLAKVHEDVVEEMRKEGLIRAANYEYLTDEEAVVPWEEIKIEDGDSACF